ncbi:MAG TPA: ATP-binding protein [Dehalococcoidia bacterium]
MEERDEIKDVDALRREVAVLSRLVDALEAAAVATDAHGSVTYWSRSAERLYGWRAEEVLGRNVLEVTAAQWSRAEAAAVAERLRRGETWSGELTVRRRDGSTFPALVTKAPILDGKGRLVGVASTATDLTGRKRLEEEQRFLAQAGTILAQTLDYEATLSAIARLAVPFLADWCLVDVLDAGGRLRRVALAHPNPEQEALGRRMEEHIRLDPDTAHGLPWVLRTGRPELHPVVTDEDLRQIARDERHLRLLRAVGMTSYMAVPLRAGGRVLGALSFISTDPGRRYGQQDLALAQMLADRAGLAVDNARLYREAMEAVRVRDEFLTAASHDLKGPLTVIRGLAQHLRRAALGLDGTAAATLREGLDGIEDAAVRMSALIAELVDVAHLQMGRPLQLRRGPVDLVALARRAVQEQQRTAARHAVRLEAAVPELVGSWDADRLERVLLNLLSNAVKYSPDGGEVLVTVAAEGGPERAHAILRVEDRGLGIPPADLPHIFDRFYRGANVAARIPGTGVGLAVARHIVEQHGGTIAAESREGAGSRFTVRLPLAPGAGR